MTKSNRHIPEETVRRFELVKQVLREVLKDAEEPRVPEPSSRRTRNAESDTPKFLDDEAAPIDLS